MAVAARRETVAALSCQTCSYGVWDMHSTVECLLRRKLTGRFVSLVLLREGRVWGSENRSSTVTCGLEVTVHKVENRTFQHGQPRSFSANRQGPQRPMNGPPWRFS